MRGDSAIACGDGSGNDSARRRLAPVRLADQCGWPRAARRTVGAMKKKTPHGAASAVRHWDHIWTTMHGASRPSPQPSPGGRGGRMRRTSAGCVAQRPDASHSRRRRHFANALSFLFPPARRYAIRSRTSSFCRMLIRPVGMREVLARPRVSMSFLATLTGSPP